MSGDEARPLPAVPGAVVARQIGNLIAERDELAAKLARIRELHYLADDDPGGSPYCPQCQAYDGTGAPCPTLRILDGVE